MAKRTKKAPEPEVEEVEEDEESDDLEDLEDLEDLADEVEEDVEDEEEGDEDEAPKRKAKGKKKGKAKKEKSTIGSADLAEALGVSGRELRVMLRDHEVEKNENGRYEWPSVDAALEEMEFDSIEDAQEALSESRAKIGR